MTSVSADGLRPESVTIGDFDNDEALDLVVAYDVEKWHRYSLERWYWYVS